MNTIYKITGAAAIRLAERDSLTIHCANDEDSLIYVTVQPSGWVDSEGRSLSTMDGYHVSDYFTSSGMYLGPDDDNIEPSWDDAVIK